MNFLVEIVPNTPINSNCYIIYTKRDSACIIVDPGTEDSADIITFLKNNHLYPNYILLTHEHFDHIWGVNRLKDFFNPLIICSYDCAKNIIDSKKNLSLFYNQVGFKTYDADIFIEEIGCKLQWNEITIRFILTPGHSNGSICILMDKILFTGDTIIKNYKTVIKLPGGSKMKLMESIIYLDEIAEGNELIVYPGHGEVFCYSEVSNLDIF